MMSIRRVFLIAGLLCIPEIIHQLWHVDEWSNNWTRRTWMAWADPCLQTGALTCHAAVVLSGWVPLLWLAYSFWKSRRHIAVLTALWDGM